MTALRWLKKYWYVPLFVLAVFLGFMLSRKSRARGTPLVQTLRELDAIKAGAEVEKVKAQLGAEQAKAHVEDKYREEIDALDEKQKERLEKMEEDPMAMARFLVRAGKPSG
jgi:hypothetical protein